MGMGETLSLTERLESLKAGIIAGGMAVFAEGLFQVAQGQWLANIGLLGSVEPHFDGLFAGYLAIAGLSGFLFGVTCRYAIREDNNPHLSSGVVLAFGLVRGLARVNLEDVTPQMGLLILFAVLECVGVCWSVCDRLFGVIHGDAMGMGEVLPMSTSIFNLTNPEIYVLTAAHEGQVGGQVATWVTLAALVPEHLRVVTILSPRNFTFGLIRQSKRFVLNLLAQGQQNWLPLFGLYSMREVDKFAEIAIERTADGIPILPDTCGWAECQIVQEVDLGDRVIIIADVLNHQVYTERKPLCRVEAMAELPPEVTQELAAKRLEDIECDRGLMERHRS